MMNRFNYKEPQQLIDAAAQMGMNIPWSDTIDKLLEPAELSNIKLSNRLFIHPMEGFDGTFKGAPDELTFRRYQRFASGGAGLIWMEAVSVTEDGRSNPRQLLLVKKNREDFERLIEQIHTNDVPVIIQLTHSGKYAKPAAGCQKLNDDDLKRIRDAHIESAILAEKLGIEGVDIKICHGYLFHEILSDVTRKDSLYRGVNLENRLRLPSEVLAGISDTTKLLQTVRLNVFDGIVKGWGTKPDQPNQVSLDETAVLMKMPAFKSVDLWSVTAGIPYINPWVTRPFDKPAKEALPSPEHPLIGVLRMIDLTARVKQLTSAPVVGAGLSWLREYLPFVGEGILQENKADFIGMGRMAFAYPDLINDLIKQGRIDRKKVCTACSGCTNRVRSGMTAGCTIRDREYYA